MFLCLCQNHSPRDVVPERRLINTLYKVDMKLMAPSKNVCLTIFKISFINFTRISIKARVRVALPI